jgi:hypothetical protein
LVVVEVVAIVVVGTYLPLSNPEYGSGMLDTGYLASVLGAFTEQL